MKILLINPPSFNMIPSEVPSLVTEERGCNPPLGIMYIASCLKKYTDSDVKILDTQVEAMGYEKIKSFIKREKPDLVGVSAMTFTFIDSINIARIIKSLDYEIKVVFGGNHANLFPLETISIPEVDFLVLGEGEFSIVELVKNIDKPKKLKKIKNIFFKNKNKIIQTKSKEFIKNLDILPFPARKLTEYKKYSSLLAKRIPVTTMMTSRGCPYNCSFCERPHLGKIFRARSAKNVVDEMEECKNMGIKEILIYDDIFTIDKKRILKICKKIEEKKLDILWDIRSRTDTVDKEMLKKMKKAGCERIHYGVESGNQKILDLLRKGINLGQVEKVFKLTKKIGIETLAYFMIGPPGETKNTALQTINFAKRINPDYVHFSLTTPFPGTDLYKQGLQKGIIEKDYWKEFTNEPNTNFKPKLWEENLSKEELMKLLKYAYTNFYRRPNYIIKSLLKIKSVNELKRKTKSGAKLFFKF